MLTLDPNPLPLIPLDEMETCAPIDHADRDDPHALITPADRAAYAGALIYQSTTQLIAMIANEAFQANVLEGLGDGRNQRACDLLFEECMRRGEPGLYEQGLAKAR
jgi:hypothetical protein